MHAKVYYYYGGYLEISIFQVVCSQVSCGPAIAALSKGQFGEGTGPIFMDNVNCTGQETSLEVCPYNGWGVHNCEYGEGAGVICEGNCRSIVHTMC